MGCDWPGVSAANLCGEDHAVELGEHVAYRRLGPGWIPRGEGSGCGDVVGMMACGRVPADDEDVHDEPEGDCAQHCLLDAVAGLADAAELLCVFDGDLDRPARRVAVNDLSDGGVDISGDERDVVAGGRVCLGRAPPARLASLFHAAAAGEGGGCAKVPVL